MTSPELGKWTAVRARDPYSSRGQDADDEGPAELVREAAEAWVALVSLRFVLMLRKAFAYLLHFG